MKSETTASIVSLNINKYINPITSHLQQDHLHRISGNVHPPQFLSKNIAWPKHIRIHFIIPISKNLLSEKRKV
jgi:hypothetical protein